MAPGLAPSANSGGDITSSFLEELQTALSYQPKDRYSALQNPSLLQGLNLRNYFAIANE